MRCESEEDQPDQLFEQSLDIGEESVDLNTTENIEVNNATIIKKPHVCHIDGCNSRFSKLSVLKRHLYTHNGERPFKCNVSGCENSYTCKAHLQRHIASSHTLPQFKKLFKCNFPGCGMSVRHQSNLRRHYERAHTPRQFKHKCPNCPQSFPKQSQLLVHQAEHKDGAPYKCSECNLGFLRPTLLTRHKRTHAIYTCDVPGCPEAGVKFERFIQLRKHRRLMHTTVLHCEACGHNFVSKANLRIHMKIHLDEREKEIFVCPYQDCSRYYRYKKNLQQHIRVVHEQVRHPCTHEGCTKTLSSLTKLRHHLKTHEPDYDSGRKYLRRPERKQRKDVGIPHRSLAVKLAGATVPIEYERNILFGHKSRCVSPYNVLVFTDNAKTNNTENSNCAHHDGENTT